MEKDIERKLKLRTEREGCVCLKFVSPGCAGVPDRIILVPGGRIAFAELKAPGEKERKIQKYMQEKIRELGFPVFSSVDSDEKIDEIVRWCKGEGG